MDWGTETMTVRQWWFLGAGIFCGVMAPSWIGVHLLPQHSPMWRMFDAMITVGLFMAIALWIEGKVPKRRD